MVRAHLQYDLTLPGIIKKEMFLLVLLRLLLLLSYFTSALVGSGSAPHNT